MGFGVLEPHGSLENVPGTATLEDEGEHRLDLKRGTGNDSAIVLIPQPSDDPNDPLNWPLWQRDLILALYAYCTLTCVGGVGPVLSVMALPLLQEFNIGFTQVSLLTGYNLLAVGACAVFVSALSRKFGKRPMMLASLLFCFVGTIWGGATLTYGSMVGARVVQGLGMAMFESVAFAIIGDLYHVHQRGSRLGVYILSLSGVAHLPSLIAGKISEDLGWRWVFWLLAIFLGVGLLAAIFFGWETTWNRDKNVNIVHGKNHSDHLENSDLQKTGTETDRSRASWIQRMRPWSGTYTDESMLSMVVRPLLILLNPAVLWAVIIIAFTQVWTVAISFLIAQLFSAPPYSLTTAQIGYISAGPMVGGLLGCLLCGLISDPIVKVVSKRNNGIYEPEFRLLVMIAMPVLSSIGYFLFGNLAAQGKSAVALSALWGITFASTQFATHSTGAYLVDAFPNRSVEIFIISMSVKNFVFFGFSFFLNDWLTSWGPAAVFNFTGGITLGLFVTTIPVYVFGKRLRAWWHTHDATKWI